MGAAMQRDNPALTLHALGEAALLCELPAPATLAQQQRIWSLAELAAQWPHMREVLPGMNNLTLIFDPDQGDIADYETRVQKAWPKLSGGPRGGRQIDIAVHYGGAEGPDLAEVAAHAGLDAAEVVRRHTAGEYVVYFLGFLPGFAFMGGLDPQLATPRRSEPRTAVPAGTVGIGGEQTGVYPIVSPGGWQLIGRTALPMFDPTAASPTLLLPGDRVRFVAQRVAL